MKREVRCDHCRAVVTVGRDGSIICDCGYVACEGCKIGTSCRYCAPTAVAA